MAALRVAIGCDHGGFVLKRTLVEELGRLGHEVLDLGTDSEAPVDYPDFAQAVAEAVLRGDAALGVLMCGSGAGASIAANKVPGIRAALCHDTYTAHQCREHDDANVLVLGARVIGRALACDVLRVFLAAEFSGEARHVRRLSKIAAIESRYSCRTSDEP